MKEENDRQEALRDTNQPSTTAEVVGTISRRQFEEAYLHATKANKDRNERSLKATICRSQFLEFYLRLIMHWYNLIDEEPHSWSKIGSQVCSFNSSYLKPFAED